MAIEDNIGALVRAVAVPPQTNTPDITVVSLDLHERGFVVRCKLGEKATLRPPLLPAMDLLDSQATSYDAVEHGEDYVAYSPAIPATAEWIAIRTSPETRVPLSGNEPSSTVGPPCPFCGHPQTEGPGASIGASGSPVRLYEWRCPSCGMTHNAQDQRDVR